MLPLVKFETFIGIVASVTPDRTTELEIKLAEENPVLFDMLSKIETFSELSEKEKRCFVNGFLTCYDLLSVQAECDELRDTQ